MTRKISINMVMEAEYTPEMTRIEEAGGEIGIHDFARDELQKILDGDDTKGEWGAGIFSIVIK